MTANFSAARSLMVERVFPRHLALLLLVALHACVAVAIGILLEVPYRAGMAGRLLVLFQVLIPCFLVALLFWQFGKMALVIRPDRPIAWLGSYLRRLLLDGDRLMGGVLALAAVALFMGSFSFVKPLIPRMAPFSWDPQLAALDRLLHFGLDPYRLLMPIVAHPHVLKALNVAYHAWFFLFYFLVFIAAFSKGRERNIFLCAFVLTWALGGNGLAILLSSGGPVYYEALGFGADFAPLLEMLRAADEVTTLWALDVQASLWDSYRGLAAPRGISAMPSMHVAVSVLMTLYAYRHARWAGRIFLAFTTVIMIGSVALAWHYAVDGYVGAAVALACWQIARRMNHDTTSAAARMEPAI